jgi:hypothetical protein
MVTSTNIIRDTIYFIKNKILNNITDPIASNRPSTESFVMTSYPTKPVRYPLITIKDTNSEDIKILGLQSQAMHHYITMEVRIWARTVQERDTLTDSVYDKFRTSQIGASNTSQADNLHDFKILSMVNIDEADGPKSKVIQIKYLYIST